MPPGNGLIAQIRPLLIVMIAMMLGNFIQIVIWGVLFICLGEFSRAVRGGLPFSGELHLVGLR